jgi:hypothetical protein
MHPFPFLVEEKKLMSGGSSPRTVVVKQEVNGFLLYEHKGGLRLFIALK